MLRMQVPGPCFLWRCQERKIQTPYLTDGGLSIPWLEMASSCVFLLLVSVFKFPSHQHMPYWTRLCQVMASLRVNSAPVVWEWVLPALTGATNSCTLSFSLQLALAGVCQSHRGPIAVLPTTASVNHPQRVAVLFRLLKRSISLLPALQGELNY